LKKHQGEKMTYTATLYDSDFYTWTIETAKLLRERRFEELSLNNLIEEVETLRREQYRRLSSCLESLLIVLLRTQIDPDPLNQQLGAKIASADRLAVQRILSENPRLQPRLSEAWQEAWETAVIKIQQRDNSLDAAAIPADNPFTLNQALADEEGRE
jgi:hypothetical protein